jgi:hypothetical protein
MKALVLYTPAALRRGLGLLAGLALAWLLALPATVRAADNALVISYSVPPAHRVALRTALTQGTQARLKRLQDEGVLASWRLLFTRHADADQWDALAVVVFNGSAQMARWAAVERETPAALDAPALALLSSVHTVPVEVVRSQRDANPAPQPVVLVVPYVALVSPADYLAYADGYVIPQFQGWMKEGVIGQYTLLSSTYPAARPWTHLILLDYRSDEALAQRAAVTAKVRAQLKNVPAWQAISESKAKVRDERQATVADDITAR